ncbi:MAG: hypothetical protein AAGJ93_00420 [Bacteroidota bacterium]
MSFFKEAFPPLQRVPPSYQAHSLGSSNILSHIFDGLRIKGRKGVEIREETLDSQKYCRIKTSIYLLFDQAISPELLHYRDYFENNLIKIWDQKNFTNDDTEIVTTKLETKVVLMPLVPLEENTLPNVVDFKTQFVNGEIVLYLQNIMQRSFINKDKRTGVMNIRDMDSNTPAHEFGHLLGLSDRYAYFHFYVPGSQKIPESNKFNHVPDSQKISKGSVGSKKIIDVGQFREKNKKDMYGSYYISGGSPIAMIEPYYAGDTEYGEYENWKENLMSTSGENLTSYQLRLVCSQQNEQKYKQYSFFGPSDTKIGLMPSIIGLKDKEVIVDKNHQIRDLIDLESIDQPIGFHYFNPTVGSSSIDETQYYQPTGIIDQDSLAQLEYGGKSRGEIIDRALTNDKLQQIEAKIKLAETGVIGNEITIRTHLADKFQHTGRGDNVGRRIWSKSVDRTYYHILTIDASTQKRRRIISLKVFKITPINFFYNRKKIFEMYMLGN